MPESVLSGIVVLGECVDKTEKIAIVLAGWKPELSAAAADAKQTIKEKTHAAIQQCRARNNSAVAK